MNHGMIRLMLGRLLVLLAGLLAVPFVVALIYRESWKLIAVFLITIGISALSGLLLCYRPPKIRRIYAREGFVICAISWLLLSLIGALPFYMSAYIPNYIDALFETASGFTTTGASILTDVEALPHSLIFWRSFTHLIGGMGVLVFVVAIMPNAGSDSANVNILKAEISGPTFGKIMLKIKNMTRTLYLIYLGMTLVVVILLLLGGMNLFDALVQAFGVAGTGGLSSKNHSIASFHSPYIEYVICISMIFFGVNFNLYYLLLMKQFKEVFKNEELRWYLLAIVSSVVAITYSLRHIYNFSDAFRNALFNVSSYMSSGGFGTVDITKWPQFAQTVLILLAFCCACAGSTSGGIKVYRIVILFKTIKAEIIHVLSPNRVHHIKMDGKALPKETVAGIRSYFAIYMLVFASILFCLSFDKFDFTTSLTATVATINNVGPGLNLVGPAGNYSIFSNFSKLVLTFSMIAGRLEILPVLLALSPRAWRRG